MSIQDKNKQLILVGGTVSLISGGKFGNGAVSAAVVYLFNDMGKVAHHTEKNLGFMDKAHDIARRASSEVKKRGTLFHWDGEHNGRWDAIRHCTGGCMVRNELGYVKAWLVGAGHELENIYDNPSMSTYEECSMDMHNNQVGFSIANGNSYYCIGSCYGAEQSGMLVTSPTR